MRARLGQKGKWYDAIASDILTSIFSDLIFCVPIFIEVKHIFLIIFLVLIIIRSCGRVTLSELNTLRKMSKEW